MLWIGCARRAMERMDLIVDPKQRKVFPREERGPLLSSKAAGAGGIF